MDRSQKRFLLFLVIAISVLFLWMVKSFLITLLLAAIFAAMIMPCQRFLCSKTNGKKSLSAFLTLVLFIGAVGIPLFAFLGLVAGQAVDISQAARPWIESQISDAGSWNDLLTRYPILASILPEEADFLEKLSEFAAAAGRFLADSVVEVSRGTAAFSLQVFVLLYSMFFFIKDGSSILDRILYYVPLPEKSEQELVDKIVSVAGAVIKGSLVIGVIQGGLAGGAFWMAGIPGWAFWTTVMIVLSIIPAVGSALVWIPAAVFLFAQGPFGVALAFTLWCVLVVGTVDNFLRPRLVGKDTKMPDILVLISTLGGIFLFGAVGFILGPIIAALFLGVWYIYGDMFSESLGERPKSMQTSNDGPEDVTENPSVSTSNPETGEQES